MEAFAIDELLFVHLDNQQLWVIGIINTITKKFRLELSFTRNATVLKTIIQKHIKRGNVIVSDAWAGYNWLSEAQYGYVHHIHNHGHGDFCLGIDCTFHVEQLWSNLKCIIINLYYSIPHKNFIIFIRESEQRRISSNYTNKKKTGEILDFIKYIADLGINNLYSDEELLMI